MAVLEGVVDAQTRDILPPEPMRHVREAFRRSVAVVLGVNAYGHGVPRLKTAVPDAEAIGAMLEEKHGFKQVMRRDGEVTGQSVRALFKGELRDELGDELGERDRLLVYFAGHGLSVPSEQGPQGHLLFADADPADPRSFFAMSELRKLLGAQRCRHLLVVLDCCFAGTFRWAGKRRERSDVGARAYRETLERYVNHRAWQVLVSACHDQTALDSLGDGRPSEVPSMRRPFDSVTPDAVSALGENRLEIGRHSPFAKALLRGLGGEADFTKDGLIIAAELELFVRDAVEKATHVQQTPQLYKLDEHDRGEFVFQVPGTTLDLEPAPALSLAACPYQGLQPYGAPERARFFGRKRVVEALVDRVKAQPFTALIGPSGVGKSSLLAAGVGPTLRDAKTWTVLDARPGTTPDTTLRDLIHVPTEGGINPGTTLSERITAWMSAHPGAHLCLALDQAEELETLARPEARDRTLADLAQALEAHGTRLRVVFALRSEFDPVFRSSPLAPFWAAGIFVVPPLAQDELREIIERPARANELSFDPPELVDTLINEVLQAPGGLPLLSFALRELYVRCAKRNCDRLLLETDYAAMGRLSGALSQRASELLHELATKDGAYAATARRVFLRMAVSRDGEWQRRRVNIDELDYGVLSENQRVKALLTAFKEARLLVSDKNEWEPAHDELIRGWPAFSSWRAGFGDTALALQLDVADAARRWSEKKRPGYLWDEDERLPAALRAAHEPASWLNAREHDFIATSKRRQRRRTSAWAASIALVLLSTLAIWDLYYRTHVDYYLDYVRRWGAPEGVDSLSARQPGQRAAKVKLVRKGRLGRVDHVELVGGDGQLARSNEKSLGSSPELDIGQKSEGERMPCQWTFVYDSSGDVTSEAAKDRAGQTLYTLQYLPSSRMQRRAQFFDPIRNVGTMGARGNAELVEFVRSEQGLDVEKRYLTRLGEPAREQNGVSVERFQYDTGSHLVENSFFDEGGKPTRHKEGIALLRRGYDARGNEVEVAYFDETGKPVRDKNGVALWHRSYDARGNAVEVAVFDEAGNPTRDKNGVALVHRTYDARSNEVERAYFDEAGQPTRHRDGHALMRSGYDARGNEVERAYFDEAGKPTRLKDGYALVHRAYDARGNAVEVAYFDETGKPVRDKNGVALWRRSYDARGNEVERAFFDETGKPVRDKNGVALWRRSYDARGNAVERAYFDEAGNPTRHKDGYASVRTTYDARGNEVEVAYFDEAGKPTRHKDGYAGWGATFDERGNEIETRLLNEAGRPMQLRSGVAVIRKRYNERDELVETAWHDLAGKLIARQGPS